MVVTICIENHAGTGLPGDKSDRTLSSARAFPDKLVNRMFQSELRARTTSERALAGHFGRLDCCVLNSSYVDAMLGPPMESFLINSAACSIARAS
jgi:hypothetical protein